LNDLAVTRAASWIVGRFGLRNLLALVLLLVVLTSVVLRIAGEIRELDVVLMLTVALIALAVGWGMAAMRLPSGAAGILALILGCGGLFLRVGRLGGKLVMLLWTLADLCWDALRLLLGVDAPLPDWISFLLSLADLWAAVSTLFFRVRDWLLALAVGEPVFDPVAAMLAWGMAFWVMSVWAGWMVRRHKRPLYAITPAGVLLVAVLYHVGAESYILLVLLGAALLLLSLMAYDVRIRHWLANAIDFPDLGIDVAVPAVLLSVVLVTAAAIAPSISVQKIVDALRRPATGQTARDGADAESIGAGRRPWQGGPATTFDELRGGGLPRRHLIGSGPELSEQVVMVISTGDLPPGPPEMTVHNPPPRYYWRGVTYDRYAQYGWRTGDTATTKYQVGQAIFTPTLMTAQRIVRQEVQVVSDLGGLLHAAGTLVAADSEYSVAWRSHDDAFGATVDATTYVADSVVTEPSEAQLRSAGTDYPEWVKARYLALPDTVPARVLSLARDLTATEPTPYDRARAIEAYLRVFPYTLDVPEPPHGRDIADYFLFDLQKGYCDYYATAMVVLARAAGLPARLAVGYATGFYDTYNAYYVVTEDVAHAWVEVYFPGYGWVAFEPTGGRPPIERPGETGASEWPEPEGSLGSATARWLERDWSWWEGVLGGLVLLVSAGVAWSAADNWRLLRLRPAATVTALHGRLQRHGRQLAVPARPGDTPYEFAAAFAGWAERLEHEKRWGGLVAEVAYEVRRLTDFYVQVSYSSQALSGIDRWRAMQDWKRVHWRLWLARVLRRRRSKRSQRG
jgi:transglutaminase-like putative cysteine protease